MAKQKRRLLIGGAALLLLAGVLYFSQTLPVVNCLMVGTGNFMRIDQNVYCSQGTSESMRDSLLVLVEHAKRRNDDFWEHKTQVAFTVIFCSTKEEMRKYAGNENYHVISLITPAGTFIVTDSTGMDLDILSHEMNHSVLAKTVGYKAYSKLPVWFTEGVALQLDQRALMIDTLFQKKYKSNDDSLANISRHEVFHHEDWEITRKNYLVSRYEIEKWIEYCGKERLFVLIAALKNGEDFDKQYKLKKGGV